MLIDHSLITGPAWQLITVLQAALLILALWKAPWLQVLRVATYSHLLFGSSVFLLLLWHTKGQIAPAVQLHLLGMTTITLLLGLPLAIIVGTVVSGALVVMESLSFSHLFVHALVNATLPALITSALLQIILRHAPRNLFFYMLGTGFVGGGLSMFASILLSLALLTASGHGEILAEWLSPIMLLAMFPEGFLNGAIVTSLAVYKPHWLRTFDDKHFLDGV